MSLIKVIFLGVTVYLISFSTSFHVEAQTVKELSKNKIDSALSLRFSEINKLDTLMPFGSRAVYYKKVFKLIRVRNGKGEIYNRNILYNKKLLSFKETNIRNKWRFTEYDIYEYFFIDQELVKYTNTKFKTRNHKSDKLHHEISIYFDSHKIVNTEAEGRDNFKIKNLNSAIILETAINKLAEFSK